MSRPPAVAAERAGLLLVATGTLALVATRGYVEGTQSVSRDLALGFGAFVALVLLAGAPRLPRWAGPLALGTTVAAHLWAATLAGGADWAVGLLVVAAAIAYFGAGPGVGTLAVGGFALWTPALQLFSEYRLVAPALLVAAVIALVLVLLMAVLPAPTHEERVRRLGLAALGVAVTAAVFERHTLVASNVLAPDEVVALVAPLAFAALALPWLRRSTGDAIATGLAFAAYVLVAMSLLLSKPYGVDAVAAPHHAAELLLSGAHPYVAFDMRDALARFGLGLDLATNLEDGSILLSLNYPALSFLFATPFIALGLTDMRWVYLGEVLLLGLLVLRRARLPWPPLAAVLLVGNTNLMRQYVLAGVDPTWGLGVAVAWLFHERRWLSPVALGLAAASRQTAWFFVPFYLVHAWRAAGWAEAVRRGAVAALAFAVPNLPFAITAPGAYFEGMLAPILWPLEPNGVGIVRVGFLGPLPLWPRGLYTVVAAAVFALLLLVVWRRWRELRNAPLTLPVVPLYFAWRSLQNYFVMLPLFAVIRVGDVEQDDGAADTTRRPSARAGPHTVTAP